MNREMTQNKEKDLVGRIVTILLLVFLFVGYPLIPCSAGSWNGLIYQTPYPTSLNLFDVKFISPMKGWIAGKHGNIFHTEDGGESWEIQESGTDEDLMRVSFVNEKVGWIVGKQGSIIHTDDGGKTWIRQYNAKALLSKVFFLNEKEGWVMGSTPIGVVLHTHDSGKTWEQVEVGIARAISSAYFVNAQTGWILAGEDVYRTTDGGKAWEKSSLPVSMPPRDRMPNSYPGSTQRESGSGFSMIPNDEGLGYEYWYGGIAFTNEKEGWAAVDRWIFHTHDGGKTWNIQFDTGNPDHGLRHIDFMDPRNGCASGWSVFCTQDGGKTWQERVGTKPHDDKMLGGISLTRPSYGWAVGNYGLILKTEDSGVSWKNISHWNKCGSNPTFLNKNVGWLYDSLGFDVLCRTDDGGHTWNRQEVGIQVNDVLFIGDSTGWAAGLISETKEGKKTNYSNDSIKIWGFIKYTIDGGKTWTMQYKELFGKDDFPGISALTFVSATTGWAIGKKGAILHTEDGGKHWVHQKSGDNRYSLSHIYFRNTQVGWITGAQVTDHWLGIILHTDDGGKHWHLQYSQEGVWFDDLTFSDKQKGFASGVTEYGDTGILISTQDGGASWIERKLANIGNNRMEFLAKERGAIFSQNGFLLVTIDGGKTWDKKRIPLKKGIWNFSKIFE